MQMIVHPAIDPEGKDDEELLQLTRAVSPVSSPRHSLLLRPHPYFSGLRCEGLGYQSKQGVGKTGDFGKDPGGFFL